MKIVVVMTGAIFGIRLLEVLATISYRLDDLAAHTSWELQLTSEPTWKPYRLDRLRPARSAGRRGDAIALVGSSSRSPVVVTDTEHNGDSQS